MDIFMSSLRVSQTLLNVLNPHCIQTLKHTIGIIGAVTMEKLFSRGIQSTMILVNPYFRLLELHTSLKKKNSIEHKL